MLDIAFLLHSPTGGIGTGIPACLCMRTEPTKQGRGCQWHGQSQWDALQVVQQQVPTAANTFQQAFSQAGLPFNQAIGQQAAQFAAALAQAQQASHLLPQQINPAIQFPAGQVRVTIDRTVPITDETSA